MNLLYKATMPTVELATQTATDYTYRAYRETWVGMPYYPPVIAAVPGPATDMTIYTSWNGATEVKSWQVFGGPNGAGMLPVARRVPNPVFETRDNRRAPGGSSRRRPWTPMAPSSAQRNSCATGAWCVSHAAHPGSRPRPGNHAGGLLRSAPSKRAVLGHARDVPSPAAPDRQTRRPSTHAWHRHRATVAA